MCLGKTILVGLIELILFRLMHSFGRALVCALCCELGRVLLGVGSLLQGAEPTLPTDAWPSFRQNFQLTGNASGTLSEKLVQRWEFDTGDQVLATAAIVDGRAYVPSLSGKLYCLDLKSGKEVWHYASMKDVPANSFAPGFKSSPTVLGQMIYLGDEEGVLHAVDKTTGMVKWTYKADGEIFSSAAVSQGKVLFGAYDNSLHCVNAEDGAPIWKYSTEGYVHCAPALAGDYAIISGCDEHLRKISLKNGEQSGVLPLGTYLIASPAVFEDFLYVGTYSGEVLCVNWKTMQTVWRYAIPNRESPFQSSAAVTSDVVVVGGRDKLVHCIDRKEGTVRWTFPTRARVDSSPAIHGQRVFIGSNDGNLYEINLKSGEQISKVNTGKAISAGPAIAQGFLVIGNESREGKTICLGSQSE